MLFRSKQTWDEELLKWTTDLMGMKSNNEILRKGYFQLIGALDLMTFFPQLFF